MNYYWLVGDQTGEPGSIEECVGEYAYLPRVLNPTCGHERWWEGTCVPIGQSHIASMSQWTATIYESKVVSEDIWASIEESLRGFFTEVGLSVLWIYPGLRLGRAIVEAANTSWHFYQVGSADLFSEELVKALRDEGVTLPLVQEAVIYSGDRVARRYFELIPTKMTGIVGESVVRWNMCPRCGITRELEYRQLLPALCADRAPDFVRVMPTDSTLVSERVKTLVERLAENVLAIPASRIAVGGSATSIHELLSEARFDKQFRRRKHRQIDA